METTEFNNDIYATIRKNIRKYRKQKAMTYAKLAEITDLSHDYIRQLQSDSIGSGMSVETFYKIAVALDVSLDALTNTNALLTEI